MPSKDDTKICIRCESDTPRTERQDWYHPDYKDEKVLVWSGVCNPCVTELNDADYTAMDVIAMETARMRHEKEYDYCE